MLLTIHNPKTQKGEALGYMTAILHLAPSTLSGFNVCPMASKGCAAGCLNTSGRGTYTNVQNARTRKTLMFFNNRDIFMFELGAEIEILARRAARRGLKFVVRLNGTSDIRWENEPVTINGKTHPNLMAAFPDVHFYDYTKLPNRRNLPPNYSLTFSLSESNEQMAREVFRRGENVAVVFRDALPKTFWGAPVINGDANDLRFLDRRGVIVGLKAKGKARKDTSGFVQDSYKEENKNAA